MSIWRIAVGVFLGAIAAYICVGVFSRVTGKIAVGERARVARVVTAITPDDLIQRCGKPLSDKPIAIATERKIAYNDAIFISASRRKVRTNGGTLASTTSPTLTK